jgi:hypothetical protein
MTAILSSGTVAPDDTAEARRAVPWATVLPLAVVAAYGSGFWMVALRGAAGAIQRSSEPFTAWLRESTLLLPLYVFAVLAALTLALRWFGPRLLRKREGAATFLLVVATASVAGIVVLAASSAYDYHLQMAHLATMNATHGPCDSDCLAVQQQSTLGLQVRAVGLGTVAILLSNLVLLGLVVAFRGGRLDVASLRRARVRAGRLDPTRLFVVWGLLGAAAIHAAVIGEHLAEWPAAGIFFVVLAIAEVDVALMFLLRVRFMSFRAAAAVSALPLLVWADSRIVSLPFGPEAGVPEPVGLADAAASLLEVVVLAVAVGVLLSRGRTRRPSASPHAGLLALVAVIAVSVIGVAGGLALVGGEGHTGHAAGAAPTE